MRSIIVKIDNSVFNEIQIDRIIEMAWEDRTLFDAIKFQFGISEVDVKALMKKELKFEDTNCGARGLKIVNKTRSKKS